MSREGEPLGEAAPGATTDTAGAADAAPAAVAETGGDAETVGDASPSLLGLVGPDDAAAIASSDGALDAQSKGKGKARAQELALQLDDVPPPGTARTIEIETDSGNHETASRSRASTLSRPYTPSTRHAPDSPTMDLVASLRNQLVLLTEQAQQLNTKLVTSISKHADLEDQVFALSTERDTHRSTIQELEREKSRWEESMNTGLLVERSQIRDEMQRLAAGLVEEERKRGTAEEQKKQVENEVDDLAATLFDQANTMVASERMLRAQADSRLKETEENLAAAEAAVRDMQQHLQYFSSVPEGPAAPLIPRRFLASHMPYAEFRTLLLHLRAFRPSARARARGRDLPPTPPLSTLLAQPFINRCEVEDHTPTLRLDTAVDLGFLSRRSVSTAVITGDLLIEPVSASALGVPDSISCALCGRSVFGGHGHNTSRFGLKMFSSPSNASTAAAGMSVYVFRVAEENSAGRAYPLCRNGWCLERLRATCALWHFIRTGVVHPVWHTEDGSESTVQVQHETPKSAPGDDGVPVRIDLSSTPPDADRLTVSPAPAVTRQPVAQRSTSAPLTVTADQLAGVERRPEPRRKSGWGIGSFSKGSWASWSRPSTPASPASPPLVAKDKPSMEEMKLGAPIKLELDEKSDAAVTAANAPVEDKAVEVAQLEEKIEAPAGPAVQLEEESVTEAEPKPEGTEAEPKPEDTEADKDMSLAPAANLARSGSITSQTSAASNSDAGSFATPKGDHESLRGSLDEDEPEGKEAVVSSSPEPESGTKEATPTETPAEATAVAPTPVAPTPIATDQVEATNGDGPASAASAAVVSPTAPPRSAARAPPPPPLPKRSARRGEPTPPVTPTEPRAPVNAVDATPTAATEEPATPTAVLPPPRHPLAEAAAPVDTDSSTDATTTAVTSPGSLPPPPRHHAATSTPRRSSERPRASIDRSASGEASSSRASTAADGAASSTGDDRAFLTGDEWEVRAWRQIVKLKEDMWRARVGVVDDA